MIFKFSSENRKCTWSSGYGIQHKLVLQPRETYFKLLRTFYCPHGHGRLHDNCLLPSGSCKCRPKGTGKVTVQTFRHADFCCVTVRIVKRSKNKAASRLAWERADNSASSLELIGQKFKGENITIWYSQNDKHQRYRSATEVHYYNDEDLASASEPSDNAI